ncbi:MAG: monovalent cation/H(+) antiporter subunit G [Lentisphaerota bacterium]
MILNVFIAISLLIGLLFNTLGVVGILRFPDVYTRLHADTKATTFGSIFTSLAVILYGAGRYFDTLDGQYAALMLHTFIAVVVLAITNATGSHAIARAAHRRGHKPNPGVVDRMTEAGK